MRKPETLVMARDWSSALEVIWFEGAGAASSAGDMAFEALQALLERGYRVRRVAPGAGAEIETAAPVETLLVLGNFGGKAPELRTAAGERIPAVRDLLGLDLNAVLALVEAFRGERVLNQPRAASGEKGRSWKPWFPVIDYDRCTNCMQCLSFCLFDVYGVDEARRIQVQNQDNCKTNCPACSRVCPEVAILFPKYQAAPINGAPVSASDAAREKVKVDISALLGGDIYANLRARSAGARSRFSLERSPDKALEERKRCLAKLQGQGIIPAEVLAEIDLNSLPSPQEILQRAQDASARAEAARQALESGDY